MNDPGEQPSGGVDEARGTQRPRSGRGWRAVIGAIFGGLACLLVNAAAIALLPVFFAPGREDGHGGLAPVLCSFYCGMPVMMLAGAWWATSRRPRS